MDLPPPAPAIPRSGSGALIPILPPGLMAQRRPSRSGCQGESETRPLSLGGRGQGRLLRRAGR